MYTHRHTQTSRKQLNNLGPNFRNFFGKCLWKNLKNLPKKMLRKGAQFSKLLWKLLRKNLGKYIGKQ